MKIKIIHTADNHLCMKFSGRNYDDGLREALVNERFEALRRTVQIANEKQAHFLVIAGDLFDSTQIARAHIKRAAEILNEFAGSHVVVLPGNHDYFEAGADKLWATFRNFMNENLLILLDDCKTVSVEVGEQTINFYAGPCNSKTSKNNVIGWVKNSPKNNEHLNIGIAHGSVEGVAPDFKREYFLMTENELKQSGVDFWLLGHIHVRYPLQAQKANPVFFYPATPTPDGFDRKHEGFIWYLEVDEKKSIKMESIKTGNYRFYDFNEAVSSVEDIAKLRKKLKFEDNERALVKLKLSGSVSEEDKNALNQAIKDITNQLAYTEIDDTEIKIHITAEQINRKFAQNSLPHKLLSKLAENEEDNLALQLANQLIEKVKA